MIYTEQPEHIPGFEPACVAFDRAYPEVPAQLYGGDTEDVVALVMGITRPYVQAETLADLADELAEAGYPELGELLDLISFDIRGRLDGSQ